MYHLPEAAVLLVFCLKKTMGPCELLGSHLVYAYTVMNYSLEMK